MGGFGNNLYQISLGFFLEKKGFNVSYNFFMTKKNFFTKLLRWKTYDDSYQIPGIKQVKISFFLRFMILVKFLFSKIFKNSFCKAKFVLPKDILEELDFKKIRFICGYFQEKHQILFFREGVKKTINLLSEEKSNKFQILHSTENIIHFRGGDSNLLNENRKILEILKKSDEKWFIITDDPLFIENEVGLINIHLINSSPLNDFFMLSSAKNKLICSNSTFSWWASHLVSSKTNVFFPKNLHIKSSYLGKGKVHIIKV